MFIEDDDFFGLLEFQHLIQKGSRKHQTFKQKIFRSLPETSPLAQTKLEGVASAKLRYLLDQVLKFQKTEKIIIFYEHDNVKSLEDCERSFV
jgi:hypothetical protein